jgi:hypothetical protein
MHSNGKSNGITDAYKITARGYLMQFKKPAVFKKTIKDFNLFYSKCHDMSIMPYTRFVDSITKEFAPSDYFKAMNDIEKIKLLDTVIINLLKKFAEYMLSADGLKMVIDDRENRGNIEILRVKMDHLIMEQHNVMYQQFMKPLIHNTDQLTVKLKEETKKLTRENIELKNALKNAESKSREILSKFQKQIKTQDMQIAYLIDRSQKDEMLKQNLREQLDKLQQTPLSTNSAMNEILDEDEELNLILQESKRNISNKRNLSNKSTISTTSTISSVYIEPTKSSVETPVVTIVNPFDDQKTQSNDNINTMDNINEEEEMNKIISNIKNNKKIKPKKKIIDISELQENLLES